MLLKSLLKYCRLSLFCINIFLLSCTTSPTVSSSIETSVSFTTVSGKIVAGYGNHQPLSNLPIWINDEANREPVTLTDAEGRFILNTIPIGSLKINANDLLLQIPITSSRPIDLGVLKYPLIHPPLHYYFKVAPLPDKTVLLTKSQPIEFLNCLTVLDWKRPSKSTQEQVVWSKPPFNQYSTEELIVWFEKIAIIYNTIDLFTHRMPSGPNLDNLAADRRYLLGLWNTSDPITHSQCKYDDQSLMDLLIGHKIEVWLLGYEATLVQRLPENLAGYDQTMLCDPNKRDCLERTGDHFTVHIQPFKGYQMIRFTNVADFSTVHLIENGQEILQLPHLNTSGK